MSALDETEECMPLTILLAHQLTQKLAKLRKDGTLWYARPDCKSQVQVTHKDEKTIPEYWESFGCDHR